MKKFNFLLTLTIVLCVSMTMTSCGSAGGSGLLGDLPNTVADMRAEEASFKEKADGLTSFDDFGKLTVEAKEVEKEYEAKIAEISKGLIGTVIPYEVAEGLPYKIASDVTIESVHESGSYVKLNAPIVTTAEISVDGGRTGMPQYYKVYMICIDADGKPLGNKERQLKSLGAGYKEVIPFAPGITDDVDYNHFIADRESTSEDIINAGAIAKIRFVNKEEFDKQ